jgi:hypothetical protein
MSASQPEYFTDIQQFYQGGLRHQPIAFVPEGSRKGRSKRPSNSSYNNASFPYVDRLYDYDDQNYAICDKDCGWCGHCGDGII